MTPTTPRYSNASLELTALERGRWMSEGEARTLIADRQTALRHGTAPVEVEAASVLADVIDEMRSPSPETTPAGVLDEAWAAAEKALPPDAWIALVEAYMAVAGAIHRISDDCNANYVIPFEECAYREVDIEQAVQVLVELRRDDWQLVRTPPYGLPGLGL